jgi:hypothetical protein
MAEALASIRTQLLGKGSYGIRGLAIIFKYEFSLIFEMVERFSRFAGA